MSIRRTQSWLVGGVRRGRRTPWLFLLILACSDGTRFIDEPSDDKTAPGAVNDLKATDTAPYSAAFSWSAPADDDTSGGPVASYDLRYRIGNLDGGVWDVATRAQGEPEPSSPGELELYLLAGLAPATAYAIGIRSTDDAGLVSALSNIVFFETDPLAEADSVAPAAIGDLAALEVGSTSVRLQWTAVGDDGTVGSATEYDLRFRRDQLDEESWADATQAISEPNPGPPGTSETFEQSGLTAATTFAFAIRAIDDLGNESPLSNILFVTTAMGSPDFIDPRGIDGDPALRDVYLADHGDSSIYRAGMLGTPSRLARVPGATGVVIAGAGRLFVIAGEEMSNEGALWSVTLGSEEPVLIAEGFAFPSDVDVDPDGNVIVAIRSPGAILRLGPLGGEAPDTLLWAPDGEVTGVATDPARNLYYGILTGIGAQFHRLGPDGSDSELHALGDVGDLVADPDELGIWVLDPEQESVLRISYDGSTVDTLATDLARPVGITPATGVTPRLVYSSRDGFIYEIDRSR